MKYTLTITQKQAIVLSIATEIHARLGMGQFRDALEWLPLSEQFPLGWNDDLDDIGKILSKHMKDGIDGYRLSLSINSSKVERQPQIAWDLYQVIRHRLSWDYAIEQGIVKPGESRNWETMMQVCYDEPMRATDEPLAEMETVK